LEDFNRDQRQLETRWEFMDALIIYLNSPNPIQFAATLAAARNISHNYSDILTNERYLERRLGLLIAHDKKEWARWLFNLAAHHSKYYDPILNLSPFNETIGGSIVFDVEKGEVKLSGPLAFAIMDSFGESPTDGEVNQYRVEGIVFYDKLQIPTPYAAYDLSGDEAMKP
jgi:hypothetical protein